MPSKGILSKVCELHRDAIGFLKVAESIRKENGNRGMEYYLFYASPYATNLSFSIELSIKELWMLKDIPAEKGHRLDYLYSKLPETTRKEIDAAFHDICIEHEASENATDVRISGKTSIVSVLQTYQKAFEDWRYVHEFQGELSVPHDDLMCAGRAIREIANQEMTKFCSDIGESPDYL